jgi:hypothetical protein
MNKIKENDQTKSASGKRKPFFSPLPIQAKLKVNNPGDKFEKEADEISQEVVKKSNKQKSLDPRPSENQSFGISKKGLDSSPIDNQIVPKSVENTLKKSGRGLDPEAKSEMEAGFGEDFTDVRIHTDDSAIKSASDINARAYTSKNDIVFGKNEYHPNSLEGKKLLAHELVHVKQQTREGSSTQNQIQRNPLLTRGAEVATIVSSVISPGDLQVTADEMEGWHYANGITPPASAGRVITPRRKFVTLLLESLLTFDIYRVKIKIDFETDNRGIGNISFSVVDKEIDPLYRGNLTINLTKLDNPLGDYSTIRMTFDYSVSGNLLTLYGNESGNFTYKLYSFGSVILHESYADDMTQEITS